MPRSADLLDANVWLALVAEAHAHHAEAVEYWEREAAPRVVFCRVAQMAFLRLLTNKTVMGAHVLTPAAAWRQCVDLLALPEIQLQSEPHDLDETWARFSDLGRTSPNLWPDAYLAAFAKCAGLRLVTFDKGFSHFPGLDCLILQPRA